MSKKYHSASGTSRFTRTGSRVITNDLFLAAFLHSVGCSLSRVEKNARRRVSFVFSGSRAGELREAYRYEKVSLDMSAFRESMNNMRREMDKALGSCRVEHKPNERSRYYARQRKWTTSSPQP